MTRGDKLGLIGRLSERSWWAILLAASAGMLIIERRQTDLMLMAMVPIEVSAALLLQAQRPRLANAIVIGGIVVAFAQVLLAHNARAIRLFHGMPTVYRLGGYLPIVVAIGALLASVAILFPLPSREEDSDEIKRARYRANRNLARRPERPTLSKPLTDAGPERGKARQAPPTGRQTR
jgi:hypothetical protein